jgi:polyisoprenoid-binding protein YceI
MNRFRTFSIAAASLLFLGLAITTNAFAQSAKDLVGTWIMVSNTNTASDGKKTQPFGPSPQAILMFDSAGRYSIVVTRGGQAKFASNDRSKGTPEENQATVQNNNAHFGTYTVEEANHVINFNIEHATFPNWEGTVQKRLFSITGSELKYTVPASALGSGANEVVFKRAI